MTYAVIRQDWDESERGWGVRPDGYSLHLTEAHRKEFVREYWDRMPDEVPDEYSCPSGPPSLVNVDDDIYRLVQATKNGIHRYR